MAWGMRSYAVALAALVAAAAAADQGRPDAKLNRENEVGTTAGNGGRDDEPARRFFTARLMGNYMSGEDANVAGCILTLGFRVSDLLVLGPGVGFQDYSKNYQNVDSVPMYLSLQANLSRGKFSPLIYGRGGYNKAWYKIIGYPFTGEEDPSGPIVGFGGGFDILSAAGFGFTIAGGVQFEYMKEHWVVYFPYTGRYSPVYERGKAGSYFSIGGGVVF